MASPPPPTPAQTTTAAAAVAVRDASHPKRPLLEEDIDTARCKGNWALVRLLAAKYSTKYVTQSGKSFPPLEGVAVAESDLNIDGAQLIPPFETITPYSLVAVMQSTFKGGVGISSAAGSSGSSFLPFLETLKNVDKLADSGERGLKIQAKVLCARGLLETGQLDASMELIKDVSLNLTQAVTDMGQYGRVVAVMAAVIKSINLIILNRLPEALDAVAVISTACHSHTRSSLPPIHSALAAQCPKEEVDQYAVWVDYCFFFHIMLGASLSQYPSKQVSTSLKMYFTMIDAKENSKSTRALIFPDSRRTIAILAYYFSTFVGNKSSPFSNLPINPMASNTLSFDAFERISSLLPLYESLVTSLQPFPKGDGMTDAEKYRMELVNFCYELWVLILSMEQSDDESMGDRVERHYKLIEACYRGTKHTFHSLKLMRYLVHTFASLIKLFGDNMCIQEKKEAQKVLHAYTFLLDKKLTEAIELKQKRRREAEFLEQKKRKSQLSIDGSNSSSTNTILDDCEPSSLGAGAGVEEPKVVIRSVDGESISDVIGVLISGVRILLMIVEGEEDLLRLALSYATMAEEIIRDHGSSIPGYKPGSPEAADYSFKKVKVYQYLGIVYGEIALEVRDSDARRNYQNEACVALQAAAAADTDGVYWDVLYNLALQLAELGEINDAISVVRKCIKINSSYAPAWNLLALCLSARKEHDQAIRICEVGFKESAAVLARNRQQSSAVATVNANGNLSAAESSKPGGNSANFSWDLVESVDKEDLLNLKITQLSIELIQYGPQSALETLQNFFILYRKLFGNVSVEKTQPQSDSPERMSDGRPSKIAQFANVPTSPSTAVLPALFRFRVYDMQIGLWLTAASLYRELALLEEARQAIAEAELIAEALVKMDELVRKGNSRIFHGDYNVMAAMQERHWTGKNSGKLSSHKMLKRGTSTGQVDEAISTSRWGMVEAPLRRILSDISFESNMIRLAKYKQQQLAIIKSPSSKSKLGKYLSPVQQAEAEYKASKRSGVFKGSNGFYKRGNMSNISVATSITSPSGPEASRLTMTSNSNFDEDGIELAITMEGLIEDFFRTTLIDDDHIPTRVHLGILHLECGNDYLSEHWLERAMKRGKSRGAGGGKSGLTTYYGGHSSRLGWEAWRTLGKIKAKTDRLDQAKECMFYAVALEQCSPARGLECLGRLITSQREW